MSQNKIISAFVEIIKEQNRKQIEKTLWANSQYSQIESLKNDYSGRAGELLAASICENLGINYVYVEDEVNQNDGTYDIIINGRKVEVKTARVGNDGKTWQHESLRDYGCDYFLFIDIDPNALFLSIFSSNFDFSEKHPVFGRTPHLRKESTGTYKFDFGPATLRKGIEAGLTLRVDASTTDTEIKKFFEDHIGK
jgi:hypothetical protein